MGRRGFTLVELMIVVAIIGVLAALAIYGVNRYLASSKSAEAKNGLGALSRGASAAFEREVSVSEVLTEGMESVAAAHTLCGNATPVPAVVPAGKKYQPSTAQGMDFETASSVTGWRCVKYALTQPHYYQYQYVVNGSTGLASGGAAMSNCADCYQAAAFGDLDGDGIHSGFSTRGLVNTTTQQLKRDTQLELVNELE
jgi:type IV pilus assembly protein PilA